MSLKTTLTVLGVTLALASFSAAPAYAFSFGAHNPVSVDDPEVANCTLFGPNSYANNPSCETVIANINLGTTQHGSSCEPWEVWGGAAGCICVKP